MKMSADSCLEVLIFAMCFWIAVTYTIPDDGLLLTGDTESTIYNADGAKKATTDDNLRLGVRKRLHGTLRKPSAIDTLEDFNALVKALGTHTDKLDARTLLPDKRAHMNDAFQTITELLKANADTLDTLTGQVNTLTEDVHMLKGNADTRLDTLTGHVDTLTGNAKMMETELLTKLEKFKTISDKQNANAEKLDNLAKDVARLGLYSSCLDYRKAGYTTSGEYRIYIPKTTDTLNVYCNQVTDGGGWLVFQRRHDGSVDFYRNWVDYKVGFGETSGEFWLGNDYLHSLTGDKQELRVDLMDFQGNTVYAQYSTFAVGSESEKYALTVEGYSGTAGDSLEYHNGMSFSTKDRDNDGAGNSCAQSYKGGWWYSNCHYSNLNGIYYDSAKNGDMGLNWWHWKPTRESLKKSEMKLRPKQ